MAREADFTQKTKDLLAGKVGFCCSAPFCRKPTIGANADMSGTISIGEAAHITAAEPGGPRYDPLLTREQRRDEKNGIWLCRNHAAMIDRDESFFSVALLRQWKTNAEREANGMIQGISAENISYTLRILYDDLKSCNKTVDNLIKINRDVVIAPYQLPVTANFEVKIETIVDSIGLDYASRMRNCFIAISNFRSILDVEILRFRNRNGTRQRGSFGSMMRQRIEFYIDDKKLWEYHDPDVSDESSNWLYSYRLKKGAHTVKLISNETKTHITTLPLIYNGEREIEIIYKGSNNGLFWDNIKYWLVDVRCK